MPEQVIPPDIPKQGHSHGYGHDEQPIAEQEPRGRPCKGEVVNGPFDDKGNHQLKKIHEEKAEQADGQSPAVLEEIDPEGEKASEGVPEGGVEIDMSAAHAAVRMREMNYEL